MSNGIKERTIQFVKYKGLKMKEFEELCKLSSGYVTSMRKGYGQEKLNNVLTVFPELNREWLLYGEGSMLNEDLSCTSSLKKKEEKSDTRPRIPYDAAAGTLTETIEGVTEYQYEEVPVISAFPKYDFTIRIVGRSMEPEYFAGDEVACLKVNEKRFLQWGRVHVLDTTQGVVIKRIYDNGDCITCRSYNPEFPDFSIPKEDIRSYNLVVGSLRL